MVSGYLQYNVTLENLFAPVAGILLAGFNPVVLFWTVTGFWIYFAIPAVWMQTPATVLLVGGGYLLSMHRLMPRMGFLRASVDSALEVTNDV